jgi:Tfp pilus assembly major pilin PilA
MSAALTRRAALAGRPGVLARTQTGITRLELMGSLIIIAVLAVILLHRLVRYQEIARTAVMEMTVSNMRSGLRLRVAELMMADRGAEIGRLVGQNPVQWLDAPPQNYRGQRASMEAVGLEADTWYYDTDRRVLVYVLPQGSGFLETNNRRRTLKVNVTAAKPGQVLADGSMSAGQGVALTTRVSED